jgi:carboxylesterase type B
MKIQREILATTLAGLWLYAVPAVSTSLKVDTTVGKLYGMINGSTPDVAQFLGVPFAEPPVGSLRFQPPQRKRPGPGEIDATKTSPNCPQFPLTFVTAPSVYTIDSPYLQPYGPWSEDCLTLNVWTPLQPQRSSNVSDSDGLPVLVWIFGGGFYEGGLQTNGMDPSQWIQRTGSHVVVAIK